MPAVPAAVAVNAGRRWDIGTLVRMSASATGYRRRNDAHYRRGIAGLISHTCKLMLEAPIYMI
jgi:hypothetical protein